MAKKKNTINAYEGNISDLKFDDKNFNKHTKKGKSLINQSLSRNGFGRSVLVDKDGRLISGNGITEQALDLGKEKAIIVETTGEQLVVVKRNDLSLDSKEGREMALADNVTAAVDLDWDEEALMQVHQECDDLAFEDWGIDLPDFDDGDDDPTSDDVREDSSVNDTPIEGEDGYEADSLDDIAAVVDPGDVWVLGEHRIVCGDPSESSVVKSLMQGKEVAMAFIDTIPLGLIQDDVLSAALHNASSIMTTGAPAYAWYEQKERPSVMRAYEENFKFSEEIIWVKDKSHEARLDYRMRHEPCLYGWKSGSGHKWYGGGARDSVLMFDTVRSMDGAPESKPIKLIAHLMECSTKVGDIVYDPFGQLGSVIIAAEQMRRSAYVCEVNALKCNVIIDRYIKFTGHSDGVYLLKENGMKIPFDEIKKQKGE